MCSGIRARTVDWVKVFLRVLVLASLVACILVLSGCTDHHEETCVWHSDLNIKGCDYYGFRDCVHGCTYCIRETGPDDCGQLKCAAYCAKRHGEADCLSNFKALCDIAMEEQAHLKDCDADCSQASGRVQPLFAVALLGLVQIFFSESFVTFGGVQRLAALGVLAAVCSTLHGCGCTDPEKQLSWDPDFGDFKHKADWYGKDGIWRGNPSWTWTPTHEAEEYTCKFVHQTHNVSICVVWTTHEWNCLEESFGICKCHTLAADGGYCQAWGCHSLEADQHVCRMEQSEGSESIKCDYEEFKMDEARYLDFVERQATGALTTGEQLFRWWSFGAAWGNGPPDRAGRRLEVDIGSSSRPLGDPVGVRPEVGRGTSSPEEPSAARQLQESYESHWPPVGAYSPLSRFRHFNYGDVCIANGDNLQLVKHRCPKWREIETEIAQCHCKKGSASACLEWSCEERDVGIFSVLFRTKRPIDEFTTGTEKEEYRCLRHEDGPGTRCSVWEGDIASPEEVEWTRCECVTGSCHESGAQWKCDEYELPRTRSIFFHEYRETKWMWFLIWELMACVFLGSVVVSDKDGFPALCVVTCIGCILFPFLVVTFGAPGFLLFGLPFWALRCCAGVCFFFRRRGASEQYSGGSGAMSRIFGKRESSQELS